MSIYFFHCIQFRSEFKIVTIKSRYLKLDLQSKEQIDYEHLLHLLSQTGIKTTNLGSQYDTNLQKHVLFFISPKTQRCKLIFTIITTIIITSVH